MTTTTQPLLADDVSAQSLLTTINRGDKRKCADQHFGFWCIEPKWFRSAVDAIRSGAWTPNSFDDMGEDESGEEQPLYTVTDGVAVVCIDGQMTKRGSSFGGCSTLGVRDALRTAASDARVTSIVLHICSPGGTCAGTDDLASDVRGVRAGKFGPAKPIVAYIADMGCSAAYWVASQCDTIYANTTAVIGSIGTYTVLEDDTAAQEKLGIKYRVVSTGPFKGLGADGAVTDALVADVQREVDELNSVFLAAVQAGRGDRIPDLAAIADGRSYVAETAKSLGLIDVVATLDDVVATVRAGVSSPSNQPAANHGRSGKPAPQAGKNVVAGPGDERIPMDPKKRAYLESVGLKTDATDDEATMFYNLLSPEKQAAADAAETAEETTEEAPAEPADMPAAAKEVVPVAAGKVDLQSIVAACEGDKSCAADYFLADMTVDQAKAAYEAVKAAKAATADANAKLARAEFAAKGQKPIGVISTPAKAAVPDEPESSDHATRKAWAEAKAGEIWDTDADSHKGYSTKERFVAIKSRELLGSHKRLGK